MHDNQQLITVVVAEPLDSEKIFWSALSNYWCCKDNGHSKLQLCNLLDLWLLSLLINGNLMVQIIADTRTGLSLICAYNTWHSHCELPCDTQQEGLPTEQWAGTRKLFVFVPFKFGLIRLVGGSYLTEIDNLLRAASVSVLHEGCWRWLSQSAAKGIRAALQKR